MKCVRAALADWFNTQDGTRVGFQARPVVGGIVMRWLCNQATDKTRLAEAETVTGPWAPLLPGGRRQTIVPTSQRGRYRVSLFVGTTAWSLCRMKMLIPFTIGLYLLAVMPGNAVTQETDAGKASASVQVPALPDKDLMTAYEKAASQNVLAAVNPRVFPGYFSVCADGQGFGYGNSYPSLDGHQMTDALLWLGDFETVKLNWGYVRSFQQANGRLPLAILPSLAGQLIGPAESQATVDANGGLYEHWVRGNPLAALASPTFIQNADVIYRHTRDRQWLQANIDAVNLAADYLTSLTTPEGIVQGAGYYVERPTRIAADGVAQCHAVDAYRRVAALNRVVGKNDVAVRYEQLAARIVSQFTKQFWTGDHFAEYLHPTRGLIASHGLTDVDWAALATGVALPAQEALLWPQLRGEQAFYYGGMPTGISTRPETYEDWEFAHPDRHDLAAMGRVWYLEAWCAAGCRTPRGSWMDCIAWRGKGNGTAILGANDTIPAAPAYRSPPVRRSIVSTRPI